MANLAGRLCSAETTIEIVDIVRDVENTCRDYPDRFLQFSKYLVPLFTHSSSSVRKSAFNSAISIINAQPSAAGELLSAYRISMMSPDKEVSKQAITYLPNFVAVALDYADVLIRDALVATERQVGNTESHTYIAQAMDNVKRIGIAK